VNATDEDLRAMDDPTLLERYRQIREQAEAHPGELDAVTELLRYRNEFVRRTRAEWGQP
jgi:hypothetical protein